MYQTQLTSKISVLIVDLLQCCWDFPAASQVTGDPWSFGISESLCSLTDFPLLCSMAFYSFFLFVVCLHALETRPFGFIFVNSPFIPLQNTKWLSGSPC